MSNHVTSLLRRKRLGLEVTGKAIILLMGDLASDDGSGIWASKPTMAAELETTPRTIQRQIHKLIEAGFVEEVGTRRHRNGDTIEYRIAIEAVENCPDSRERPPTQRHPLAQDVDLTAQDVTPDTASPPTQRHPTPDTVSGEPLTQCRPNQNKPNGTITPQPPKGGRRGRKENSFGVSESVKQRLREKYSSTGGGNEL
jgi:hypothetical protein